MWRRISSSALALWIVKVWHLFREGRVSGDFNKCEVDKEHNIKIFNKKEFPKQKIRIRSPTPNHGRVF